MALAKEIPTPYVWSYQPQMGVAAGASQDYSTQINWLSAGPRMAQTVFALRDQRNRVLTAEAHGQTPRPVVNPASWPAAALSHEPPPPTLLTLPRNEPTEHAMTDAGYQIAGGAAPWSGVKTGSFCGRGLQLAEPPTTAIYPSGLFQLAGGSASSFDHQAARTLLLESAPSVPRYGGIGARQFLKEFTPAVYPQPYSGPPNTFPDYFCFNYDSVSNSVDGYS
ncbi:pVIII [Mastadenovirus porcusquartum]|uniref:Pre-hexon-linking protein VIII n=1 Tax=Mastadenovirus porcusquartum TaxID=3241439 RepID=A0A5P9VIJ8_9ADEN|nr:pVIII [Porcine mastadenovirus B]QFX65729.1 pVIII [Porcine mastadenovirus B]